MLLPLSPRLNLITGDNGLGKSFLLDIAWWALTRTWARTMILPHRGSSAEISYRYEAKSGSYEYTSRFDRPNERWSVKQSRPPIPGLVLYAQVDGGFSVWDPARNYWRKSDPDRPASYLFTPTEVWEGNDKCEGIIRDWASWQREKSKAFDQLQSVLKALSPSPAEPLEAGELQKITIEDPKRYPTLKMPYGEEVPIIHASAGMRRIMALAYLLVWTWQEHVEASKLTNKMPTSEIIFLIDEVEAHLHPQWQRRIVPALLNVMDAITGPHTSNVQLITATHSPLVLASAEPDFDPDRDGWLDLNLVDTDRGRMVTLEKQTFVRQGDASHWLTSEAFNLKEARSLEAERAITEALALVSTAKPSKSQIEHVDSLLRASLSDIDRFWMRWAAFRSRIEATK
jgi:hypothetical protein